MIKSRSFLCCLPLLCSGNAGEDEDEDEGGGDVALLEVLSQGKSWLVAGYHCLSYASRSRKHAASSSGHEWSSVGMWQSGFGSSCGSRVQELAYNHADELSWKVILGPSRSLLLKERLDRDVLGKREVGGMQGQSFPSV